MSKEKTKNKKCYIKKILIPIYERKLKIVVCNSIKFGLKHVSYEKYNDEEWTEATVIQNLDSGVIIVIIKPSATINTIAHESFHITNMVMSEAGMGLCEKSEEAYAYLLGWVTERVDKAIKKYK